MILYYKYYNHDNFSYDRSLSHYDRPILFERCEKSEATHRCRSKFITQGMISKYHDLLIGTSFPEGLERLEKETSENKALRIWIEAHPEWSWFDCLDFLSEIKTRIA